MPASIVLFPVTIAIAAGLVFWTIWRVDRDVTANALRVGFQEADAPPGLLKTQPDPRLVQYSAWQMAMIPEALLFTKPLGKPHSSNNEPVHAAADGLVVLVARSETDGMRLILAHKGVDGVSQTIYSGLSEVYPTYGELVARGAQVGISESARFRFAKRQGSGLDLPALWETPETLRGDVLKSPLGIMLSAEDAPWTRLEIRNAERLSELKEAP